MTDIGLNGEASFRLCQARHIQEIALTLKELPAAQFRGLFGLPVAQPSPLFQVLESVMSPIFSVAPIFAGFILD